MVLIRFSAAFLIVVVADHVSKALARYPTVEKRPASLGPEGSFGFTGLFPTSFGKKSLGHIWGNGKSRSVLQLRYAWPPRPWTK